MCITEYNEKLHIDNVREEGGIRMLVRLVSDGTISIEKAAKEAFMSEEAFRKYMAENDSK